MVHTYIEHRHPKTLWFDTLTTNTVLEFKLIIRKFIRMGAFVKRFHMRKVSIGMVSRIISTPWLKPLRALLLEPINVVVFDEITYT